MSAKLLSLREERGKILTQYQELRDKHTGVDVAIPEADEERLAQLFAHLQIVQRDIDVEEAFVNQQARKAKFEEFRFIGPNRQTPEEQEKRAGQLAALRSLLYSQDSGSYGAAVARAAQVDIGISGGYIAMPEGTIDGLIEDAKKEFVSRKYCRSLGRMNRAGGSANRLTNRLAANWGGELSAPVASELKFGKKSLKPNDLSAMAIISRPLLRESNIESTVMVEIGYAKGDLEETAFFKGNGNNQWLGILTVSDDGIPASRDQESSASGVIKPEDIWKLCLETVRPMYYRRGRFLLSQGALGACRTMKDGNGNFIWNPTGNIGDSLATGVPGLLCGKPYDVSEYMDPVAAGNYPIIFGDFNEYGIVDGDSDEMQVLYEKYATENCNAYLYRSASDGAPLKPEAFARLKVKA